MEAILLCYFVGQLCYMLLKAQAVASSTVNGFPRGWKGAPAYFAHYWVLLIVRCISCFGLLILIVFAGSEFSSEFVPTLLGTNPYVLRVLSYFVGLGMDAALEKFQDKIPWLKGVIPPPPPPPESNGHVEGAHA